MGCASLDGNTAGVVFRSREMLADGKWHIVHSKVDFDRRTYSRYVDGVLVQTASGNIRMGGDGELRNGEHD